MAWLRLFQAFAIATFLAVPFLGGGAAALAQSLGSTQSEVLILDPNRLFAETLFGKRITDELEAEGQTLSEENRKIEAELRLEEKALTEARKAMSPEDFRDVASAFDIKVQGIRRERLSKLRALDVKRENALQGFLGAAQGALITLMREREASVLLDLRSVILRDGAVDITDEAVLKINEAIGTGEKSDGKRPAPQQDESAAPAD